MVVGTLANRASLSSSLVETLTVAMAKNIQKESAVEGAPLIRVSLMVMIQLMQVSLFQAFAPSHPVLVFYCGSIHKCFIFG
jgi:hypothetical protein